jgi:hypothetical protein
MLIAWMGMLLSVTSHILSKTEIAFLSGSREFTKPQVDVLGAGSTRS